MISAKHGLSCVIGENVIFEIPTFLGDKVRIGSGTIFTHIHAKPTTRNKETPKTIVEDDVVIGSNCTIVGNVVIKKGAIVGDGSVVTGQVHAMSFFAGNPARKIYSLSAIRQ